MYKPANVREFVTPATQKRVNVVMVNGRTQKEVTEIATLKGKFKQKATREMNANGLVVVHGTITFVTWWKADLKANDLLEINGVTYQIKGEPENVEMRGRYAVLNLEVFRGGA